MLRAINLALLLLICVVLTGCASLMGAALPKLNPFEESKGINTNLAVGKDVEGNNTKGLVNTRTGDIDVGKTNTNTSQSITTEKGNIQTTYNQTNVNWVLIGALVFFAGLAIPTRSQAKLIAQLQENLEYERARTNITVESAACSSQSRQETKHTS